MFSGKTKRKIPHSSGRCLVLPPDWLDTTQVSSLGAKGVSKITIKQPFHQGAQKCMQTEADFSKHSVDLLFLVTLVKNEVRQP